MPEELHQFFHDGLRSMVTDLLAGGGEAREVARGRDLDDLINELRDDFVAMLDFDEVPARGDAALEQWAERIGAAADRVEQWQASADPASVAVVNELADAMVGPLPPVIPGTVAEETQQFFHDGIRAVLADQLAGGATRRDAWEQSAEVRALAEQLRTHTRYGEVGVPDDEGYLVPWSVMLQRIGDTDGINLIHSFQQDWNAMLPNRDYATFNELEDDRRIYARDTTRGILESLPLSELLDGPARGVGELAPEVEGLYQRVAVAVTNRLIYGNDNPNVGFQEAQRVARELLTGAEQMAGLADVVDLLRQQTQVDAPPPYVDAPPPYTEGPADDGGRSDLVDRPSSADQPIRSYEPYENLAASVVGELPTESDPRVNELLQTVGIAFAQRPASAEFSAAVAEAWADYEIVALVDAGMDPEVVDGVIAEFRNTVDSAWDNALAAADAIRDAGVPLPDVPLRETADQASDVGPDGAGDRGEPVDQQSPKDLLRDLAQSADRLAEFPHAEAEQLRLRMLRWVQPPQGGLAKFELAQALPVYETVLSALAFQAAQKNGTLAAQRLAESLDLGLLVSIGRELANRPQTEDAAIRSLRELFLNAKADIPDTSDVTDNTPDGFSGFRPEPASEGLSSVESGGRDAGTFGSGSPGSEDGVGSWVGDGDSVSGDGARSLDGDGWDAGTFGRRSPGSEDGVGSWVGDGDSVSGDGARSLDGDGWDAGTFGSRSPVESEYGVDSWLTSVDSVSGDGARSLDGDGWDAGTFGRRSPGSEDGVGSWVGDGDSVSGDGARSLDGDSSDAGTFGSGSPGSEDRVGSWVGDGDSVSGDGARSLDGDGWDAGTFGSRSPEPEDGFGSGLGNSDSPSGDGAQSSPGERTESPGRTSRSEERVSESNVGSGTNPDPLRESYRVALSELAGADSDRRDEAFARADSILGPTLREYQMARVLMAHQYLTFPNDRAAAVRLRVELQRQMSRLAHIGAGAGPEPGAVPRPEDQAAGRSGSLMVPSRWVMVFGMRGLSDTGARSPRTRSVHGRAIAALSATLAPSRRTVVVGMRGRSGTGVWSPMMGSTRRCPVSPLSVVMVPSRRWVMVARYRLVRSTARGLLPGTPSRAPAPPLTMRMCWVMRRSMTPRETSMSSISSGQSCWSGFVAWAKTGSRPRARGAPRGLLWTMMLSPLVRTVRDAVRPGLVRGRTRITPLAVVPGRRGVRLARMLVRMLIAAAWWIRLIEPTRAIELP